MNKISVPEENITTKKSQFFLFFLLLVILLVALTGLVFMGNGKNPKMAAITSQTTPITQTAPLVNAQTQMAFVPQIQSVLEGANLKAPISVSTGVNSLSGVQFTLNFDPKIVQVMDLVPGNFFVKPTVLLKKIDNQKGKIDYALGSLTPQNGDNILAILSLKLISSTSSGTKISFSDTKAADGTNNVLKKTTPLTLNVTQK